MAESDEQTAVANSVAEVAAGIGVGVRVPPGLQPAASRSTSPRDTRLTTV
jgi:hypothetical protein